MRQVHVNPVFRSVGGRKNIRLREQLRENATAAGSEARAKGWSSHANPWPVGTKMRSWWRAGWQGAK